MFDTISWNFLLFNHEFAVYGIICLGGIITNGYDKLIRNNTIAIYLYHIHKEGTFELAYYYITLNIVLEQPSLQYERFKKTIE